MLNLRCTLEATASGLFAALLAPPVAAVTFLLISTLSSGTEQEPFDSNPASVLLLLVGVTAGAYFIGAIPAFLAGLCLPTLSRILSPAFAATATGLVGSVAYALTFGTHLFSGPNAIDSVRTHALPAFIGVTVAALMALHIERRRARAEALGQA